MWGNFLCEFAVGGHELRIVFCVELSHMKLKLDPDLSEFDSP